MYVVATLVGLFIFSLNKNGNDILYLFYADVAATVIIWLFGVWFSNSSIYDPYWSVAPPIILTFLYFYYGCMSISAVLLMIAIWFWAIRLTVNWIYTFPNLMHQDWRYVMYREENPKIWQLVNFMGIHFLPTLVVFLAMIPGFYVLQLDLNPNIWTYLSCALCVFAAVLQLVSDIQMHRFRKNNKGRVCNNGLWKYSRHPNYLGEILLWWGVYFILISVAPQYWWTIFGPIVNNLLFVFISIPLMEKRQIKNKPEYVEYIKITGSLLPKIGKNN
jgi:steroid 5-alpha reductase family enzyme